MRRSSLLLVLLALVLAFGAIHVLTASLSNTTESSSHSTSDALALTAISMPRSRLVVQNLESEGINDIEVVLRRPDGSVAAKQSFDDVQPLTPRTLELAEMPELPAGTYSAVVTGTGRIAVQARHAWPQPAGRLDLEGVEDLASEGSAEAAEELVLPFVAVNEDVEGTALFVHNPVLNRSARVDIALIPFSAEGAAPVWARQVDIVGGGLVAFEFSRDDLEDLGGTFHGFALLSADGPVRASSLLFAYNPSWARRVSAALEAAPATRGMDQLLATFHTEFEEFFPNDPPTLTTLFNPGPEESRVRLTYRPSDFSRCAESEIAGQTYSISARAAISIAHHAGLVPGLTKDCIGVVEVEALDGEFLSAELYPRYMDTSPGMTSALTHRPSPGQGFSFPWVTWRRGGQASGLASRSSAISVVNMNEDSLTARLSLRTEEGRGGLLPDVSEKLVPAGAFESWNLGSVSGSFGDESFEGAGILEADSPVSAYQYEAAAADPAIHASSPVESAGTTAGLTFLGRPPVWPTLPPFFTPAPQPTATPTRVTVEPPAPRVEPTLDPPEERRVLDIPVLDEWIGCCSALVWPEEDQVWGMDFGDGVPLSISRFDLSQGDRIGGLLDEREGSRFATRHDGEVFVLESGWSARISRFDTQGKLRASIDLPDDREWELEDLALAPAADGSIWLVDNRHFRVHHISAVGDHLATWRFYEALRHPGDGGYRIALAPDGQSLWLLSWARLLRFTLDGRLLTAVGAPKFQLGPEDFVAPVDMTVDKAGRAYVLEGSGRLRVFEPDGWEAARWQTFDALDDEGDWQQASLALGPDDQIVVSDLRRGRLHFYDPLSTVRSTPIERGPFWLYLPHVSPENLR